MQGARGKGGGLACQHPLSAFADIRHLSHPESLKHSGKTMPIAPAIIDHSKFNRAIDLPYQLRIDDISLAMQDVYDFILRCKQ